MNDLVSFDDLEPAAGPSNGQLASVAELAIRQQEEISAIIVATQELQRCLAAYKRTSEVDLPEAMRNAGVSEFKLTDGTKVAVKDHLVGTKLTAPEGLDWVEANGGSSLIKTSISVEMDRGDLSDARELLEELREHRLANKFKTLSLEQSVHQSTIASWCASLQEKNIEAPLELLGVHRRVFSQVGDKRPKSVELKGMAER